MKNLEVIDDILVVKVGTSTLIADSCIEAGEIDTKPFEMIAEQLVRQQELGKNVILVTSGAIAVGMVKAGIKTRPDKKTEEGMVELQRLSTIGWGPLLNLWDDSFAPVLVAGMQLTHREFRNEKDRREFLKVTHRNLTRKDVPTVNENDAISHEEIEFGENDKLSAHLVQELGRSAMFGSNIELLILSDVDGIYRDADDSSTIIPVVHNVLDCITYVDDTKGGANSSGKMTSKLEAAQIANSAGVDMAGSNPAIPTKIKPYFRVLFFT